ncbi:MAG: MFS transporter [Cyanobacteriota bacterium]|nr:MFS transporter [Cyanobacteriota bacterium]
MQLNCQGTLVPKGRGKGHDIPGIEQFHGGSVNKPKVLSRGVAQEAAGKRVGWQGDGVASWKPMPAEKDDVLKKIHHPLSIVFLSLLLDKLGENIVFPLLPFLLAAYRPDALTLGIVAATATLFSVLTSPLMGALADRIGRRPVILVCIGLNVISLLMFGWAGSLSAILLSRVVNGVATSTTGTLQAYITDISNPSNRARNLGIIGAAYGLGAIVGPALGGGLLGFGVSVPIFVSAGLAGYNFLTAFAFLKETIVPENRKPISLRDLNIARPLINLIKTPVLNQVAIGYACYSLSFTAFTSLLVLTLKDLFGWSPTQTSGVLVVIGITLTAVQVGLISGLVNKWGEFGVNHRGMALTILGILLIPVAKFAPPASAALIVLSGLIIAVGAALVQPTASSIISGLSPSTEQGVALGSLASLTGFMNAIGPISAGWIYDQSPTACFVFEAIVVATGIALIRTAENNQDQGLTPSR